MQTVRDLDSLRVAIDEFRTEGHRVALVPTMGALHAGHMALIEAAKARADRVVASIFVNPKQFGPNEDFDAYPRKENADAAMLEAAGCALLWLPPVEVMYPDGYSTNISVSGVTEHLDGAARPGHFDGVATVVAKLFNQVQPDIALFGEKDYQQLAVIRRMVTDLNVRIEIEGVPTQREEDGLALSSRNIYLSPEEREAARVLPRALGEAARAIAAGGDVAEALTKARGMLAKAGFDPIDYVALHDAGTLDPLTVFDRPARLFAAARIGRTRLIDNLAVE
ncbi:pantoate--beta-alanine ligase [Sphingomonas cavernae]|uniref:Pantothenate synthetase n=1 Tax=Sphingomonas cavernae TaxID=2320861 RepID=A0A418WQA1_9SPHN|nr:pantoate--beta-alanine ligase [Sphingomonas cavernae]RJF93424.1 pantoate--beta-alanine ligase [Sphingomonas cavernae]